jgi:hypothetical protein
MDNLKYHIWSNMAMKKNTVLLLVVSIFSTILLLASISAEASGALYAGVWRSGSDGYYLWTGANWPSFFAKWNELASQNLRLVDIETYTEGNNRLWAGVWRSGSDGYYLWTGANWPSFFAKWNELASQNLRLVDVNIYED